MAFELLWFIIAYSSSSVILGREPFSAGRLCLPRDQSHFERELEWRPVTVFCQAEWLYTMSTLECVK